MLLEHMHKEFEINRTKIKDGCQSGRKVVTHNSKSDLPLAALLEHMHKMVEINPTNIKGGCQSGRNNSKSDLPLMSSKQSETSESSVVSVVKFASRQSHHYQPCEKRD